MSKEIIATKGFVFIVDDDDYETVSKFKWCSSIVGKKIYAVNKRGERKYLHRFIMNNPNLYVDHINGNTLDNRRQNLRTSTHSQNLANQPKTRGKSNFKGVKIKGNRFQGKISINGRVVHLGSFKTEIDAAKAYDCSAKKYFGEYALTNF